MAEWEPILRTKQEVKGIDPTYSGLVVIEITLSPEPPREWMALWSPYPPNSTFSIAHAPPQVRGSQITLRIPENEVKAAVEALDTQISAANNWYQSQVLPRLKAQEEQGRKERDEEMRRLEAARRQLDELGWGLEELGMNLFLDTNVYLSVYRLSDDDLEELRKLSVTVQHPRATTLYLPHQVRDEFHRNREKTIAESLRLLKEGKIPTGFPRPFLSYPGYAAVRDTLATYEGQRADLVSQVQRAAVAKELPADKLIAELFASRNTFPCRTPYGRWPGSEWRLVTRLEKTNPTAMRSSGSRSWRLFPTARTYS
jgi:PIN domain-containing protein